MKNYKGIFRPRAVLSAIVKPRITFEAHEAELQKVEANFLNKQKQLKRNIKKRYHEEKLENLDKQKAEFSKRIAAIEENVQVRIAKAVSQAIQRQNSDIKAKSRKDKERKAARLRKSPDENGIKEKSAIAPVVRDIFGGFSKAGLNKLLEIYGSCQVSWRERAAASWALARWHAMRGNTTESLRFIDSLKRLAPEDTHNIKFWALEIDQLIRSSASGDALDALNSAKRTLGDQPELLMLQCNLLGHLGDYDGRALLLNQLLGVSDASLVGVNRSRPPFYELSDIKAERVVTSNTKLSILMPAFNCVDLISVAVNSVLNQTWQNLELIIVDDCSTDGTWEVVKKLAGNDGRIRILRQAINSGAYACRNAALELATGDYITVHDSDDWSHPEKYENQIDEAIKNGCYNYTHAAIVDKNLNFLISYPSTNFLTGNTSSLLVERKFVEVLGGWDRVRISADSELLNRLRASLKRKPTLVKELAPLTLLHATPNSLTKSSDTGMQSMVYGARREYRDSYLFWHATPGEAMDKSLSINGEDRPFPAPGCILSERAERHFSMVIAADLSDDNFWEFILDILRGVEPSCVALHHIPRFAAPSHSICSMIRKEIAERDLSVVVAGDIISCEWLAFLCTQHTSSVPDRKPKINSKKASLVAAGEGSNSDQEKFFSDYFGGKAKKISPDALLQEAVAHFRGDLNQKVEGVSWGFDCKFTRT